MEEYYIRTPGHDESRGPFNLAKLQTLVEAEQIDKNTLYYDEEKTEWIPIGLDEQLSEALFPAKKKLSLKLKTETVDTLQSSSDEGESIGVEDMLAAADGKTAETKHLKDEQKSLERAVAISSMSLALMMLFSSLFLILSHLELINTLSEKGDYAPLLNYPFFLVAMLDGILAIVLMLAVTEVFPIVRARAMLTLGFGAYVGWALNDPTLIAAFAAAGIGLFVSTFTRNFLKMLVTVLLGLAGHLGLAYLAINGRFNGFFDTIQLNLLP